MLLIVRVHEDYYILVESPEHPNSWRPAPANTNSNVGEGFRYVDAKVIDGPASKANILISAFGWARQLGETCSIEDLRE